ncbi:Cytochrome c oxidase subunit 5B, mitochondrial [Recurvomyces mirabilis]|uniref:Cytochrome c oxidase polypeptide V n=1 Tax=Recurvomyces mirabilis TaxID=574656 RepID=A0AAE0WIS6_9PEZI|nr:Cytochrome c oxidase subunit 5B, mitochondrial [Recurvomyces mirabilis]KAK5150463.1 Cytochrome c oxidase subunit 5B, mitochondrial [Recurvomyces mirabilis]
MAFRSALLRLPTTATTAVPVLSRSSARAPAVVLQQQQCRHAHAISNPTLANIEKRWEGMAPQEQADLWMALRDRMKGDWNELTLQEKKAAYWIAFGPHGPRALPPPGENWKVFSYTLIGIGAAGALFGLVKYFARGSPRTMTVEYQRATDEYLKENRIEPITGISSDKTNYPGSKTFQMPTPDLFDGPARKE